MRNRLSNTQLMFNTLVTKVFSQGFTDWLFNSDDPGLDYIMMEKSKEPWIEHRILERIGQQRWLWIQNTFTLRCSPSLGFSFSDFLTHLIVGFMNQWETLKASGQALSMSYCFCHSWNFGELLVLHACIRNSLKIPNSERVRCDHPIVVMFAWS